MQSTETSGLKLYCIGNYKLQGITLGKGNFAKVVLGTHRVIGAAVALKIIDTSRIKEDYVIRNLEREAKILARLDHPNIVKLYETTICNELYCLSLECIRGGDLSEHIRNHPGQRLSEIEGRNIFHQIISALSHMHRSGVLHRDLKLENILLEDPETIKLVDFGLSNFYMACCPLRTRCGSPEYAAPELFNVQVNYGSGVDVWSAGVVLFVMLVGRVPFSYPRKQASTVEGRRKLLYEKSSKGLVDEHRHAMTHLSTECQDLLHRMLDPNHKNRATIEYIEKHKWFRTLPPPPSPTATLRATLCQELHPTVMKRLIALTQIPGRELEQRIHRARFGKLYAMYHLMRDSLVKSKLNMRSKFHQNLTTYVPSAPVFHGLRYVTPRYLQNGYGDCRTTTAASSHHSCHHQVVNTVPVSKDQAGLVGKNVLYQRHDTYAPVAHAKPTGRSIPLHPYQTARDSIADVKTTTNTASVPRSYVNNVKKPRTPDTNITTHPDAIPHSEQPSSSTNNKTPVESSRRSTYGRNVVMANIPEVENEKMTRASASNEQTKPKQQKHNDPSPVLKEIFRSLTVKTAGPLVSSNPNRNVLLVNRSTSSCSTGGTKERPLAPYQRTLPTKPRTPLHTQTTEPVKSTATARKPRSTCCDQRPVGFLPPQRDNAPEVADSAGSHRPRTRDTSRNANPTVTILRRPQTVENAAVARSSETMTEVSANQQPSTSRHRPTDVAPTTRPCTKVPGKGTEPLRSNSCSANTGKDTQISKREWWARGTGDSSFANELRSNASSNATRENPLAENSLARANGFKTEGPHEYRLFPVEEENLGLEESLRSRNDSSLSRNSSQQTIQAKNVRIPKRYSVFHSTNMARRRGEIIGDTANAALTTKSECPAEPSQFIPGRNGDVPDCHDNKIRDGTFKKSFTPRTAVPHALTTSYDDERKKEEKTRQSARQGTLPTYNAPVSVANDPRSVTGAPKTYVPSWMGRPKTQSKLVDGNKGLGRNASFQRADGSARSSKLNEVSGGIHAPDSNKQYADRPPATADTKKYVTKTYSNSSLQTSRSGFSYTNQR